MEEPFHVRLEREFKIIEQHPLENLIVRGDNVNKNVYHFLIFAPDSSLLKGGVFHGMLNFSDQYPDVPPTITLYTPNGHIQTNVPLKLTQFKEQWNVDKGVVGILNIVSKSVLDKGHDGGFSVDDDTLLTLARGSMEYNVNSKKFNDLFLDVIFFTTKIREIPTQQDLIKLQRKQIDTNASPSSILNAPPLQQDSSNLWSSAPVLPNASYIPQANTLNNFNNNNLHPNQMMSSPIQIDNSNKLSPSSGSNSQSLLSSSAPNTNSNRSGSGGIIVGGGNDISPNSSMILDDDNNSPPDSEKSSLDIAVLSPRVGGPKPGKIVQNKDIKIDNNEGRAQIMNKIYAYLKEDIVKWTGTEPSKVILPKISLLTFHIGPPFNDEVPDEEKKCIFCKVRADFSSWTYLQPENLNLATGEEQRERAKELVVNVLDRVMYIGWTDFKIRFTFSEINLSDTEGSMRAVFQGTSGTGATMHRETELEVLDLSNTRTSPRSLLSLYRLQSLRELYLDHCPSIQKSGKHVFSLLLKKDEIKSLETLSVVGTSQVMSHQWLSEVEQRCPNLKRVYFSRKLGTKAIGWHDVILMQTMRDPQLLPCGHIGDRSSLLSVGYCALDRVQFRIDDLIPVNPAITVLLKDMQTKKWAATIVDFLRDPLDGKVLYHHCGNFFNIGTLQKIYEFDKDITVIDEKLLFALKDKLCTGCNKKLQTAKICYPHSAEPLEKHHFDDLASLGCYGVEFGTTGRSKKTKDGD